VGQVGVSILTLYLVGGFKIVVCLDDVDVFVYLQENLIF
jgi:hypothetical protein